MKDALALGGIGVTLPVFVLAITIRNADPAQGRIIIRHIDLDFVKRATLGDGMAHGLAIDLNRIERNLAAGRNCGRSAHLQRQAGSVQ